MNKKFIKLSGLVLAVLMLFSCAQAAGGDDTLDSGNKNVGGNTSEASFPYAKYRYFNNEGRSDGGGQYFDADLRRNSEQFSIRVAGNEVYIKDNVNGLGEHKFVWSTVGKDLYLSGYITYCKSITERNKDSTDIFLVTLPNRTSNYNEEAKVLKLDFVSYDDENTSGDDNGGGNSGSSVNASDLNGTWNYSTYTVTFNNGKVSNSKNPNAQFSYTLSGNKLTVEGNAEYTISISDNKLTIDAGNDASNKMLLNTFFGYNGGDSSFTLTK